MPVTELKDKTEWDNFKASAKLVVIDYTATWCPPCQMIKPKFEAMSAEEGFANVDFGKVDVDANATAAAEAGIQCMPTFKFYKNGEEIAKIEGANEAGIRAKIEELK